MVGSTRWNRQFTIIEVPHRCTDWPNNKKEDIEDFIISKLKLKALQRTLNSETKYPDCSWEISEAGITLLLKVNKETTKMKKL